MVAHGPAQRLRAQAGKLTQGKRVLRERLAAAVAVARKAQREAGQSGGKNSSMSGR